MIPQFSKQLVAALLGKDDEEVIQNCVLPRANHLHKLQTSRDEKDGYSIVSDFADLEVLKIKRNVAG